jgi:alcohol dehydrogenase class IV
MDVAKVTAWILGASNAKIITSKPIAIEQELLDFKKTMSKVNADANLQDKYRKALPKLAMVPTTAGTGSDGGKSAVVYFPDRKHMIGDPSLIAPYVALNPLYTQSLPSKLTAATAVDALAHAMEAYLVTSKAAEKDGMTKEQTGIADEFALHALELILTNLPTAMAMPDDLNARLALQIAALFSAKAFRKGDLGAVHATAHSIGAEFHLHHGECIARMFIPVFKFNEEHLRSWSPEDSSIKETREKFEVLRKTFERHGHRSDTLTGAIELFLRSLETPYGLEGLGPDLDFDRLSEAASVDSCNTNPIPLTIKNYKEIFQAAAGNRI